MITAFLVAAMGLTMGFLRGYLMEHLSVASGLIVTIGLMVILLGSFVTVAMRFSKSEKSLNESGRERD